MLHFSSYTPEAIRAFTGELSAEFRRRTDFVRATRDRTHAMLSRFNKDHRNTAADLGKNLREHRSRLADHELQRLRNAEEEAHERKVLVSELKSGTSTFLNKFRLELREAASGIKAASDAWRTRRSRDAYLRESSQQKNRAQSPRHQAESQEEPATEETPRPKMTSKSVKSKSKSKKSRG